MPEPKDILEELQDAEIGAQLSGDAGYRVTFTKAKKEIEELRSVPFDVGPDGEPNGPTLGAYVDAMKRIEELEQYQSGFMEVRAENSYLRGELAEKDKRIEELENAVGQAYGNRKEIVDRVLEGENLVHILSDEQIDKAWNTFCMEVRGSQMETEALTLLSDLNIVPCSECGGSGERWTEGYAEGYFVECPTCNGHKWIMRDPAPCSDCGGEGCGKQFGGGRFNLTCPTCHGERWTITPPLVDKCGQFDTEEE